jgi:hypothetical protein
MPKHFFVAVHAGAGVHSKKNEPIFLELMKQACIAAAEALNSVCFGGRS